MVLQHVWLPYADRDVSKVISEERQLEGMPQAAEVQLK